MGLTAPKAVLLACGILASATAAAAQQPPPLAAAQPGPPEATNIAVCNSMLASANADANNLMMALRRTDAMGRVTLQERDSLAQQVAELRQQVDESKKAFTTVNETNAELQREIADLRAAAERK